MQPADATDIAQQLVHYAEEPDDAPLDTAALWETLVDKLLGPQRESLWDSLPQEYLLQFISFEVLDRQSDDARARDVLESGRYRLKSAFVAAHWRALRMIAGNVDSEIEADFWADFLSEDLLISSCASAVVGPAIDRGDAAHIAHVKRLKREIDPRSEPALRIKELLRGTRWSV
jgi:hypothetical protein